MQVDSHVFLSFGVAGLLTKGLLNAMRKFILKSLKPTTLTALFVVAAQSVNGLFLRNPYATFL